MEIKVLGTGCAKCKKVEEICKEVVAELGVEATIEKVEDIRAIMGYGVMRTPGIVVDGEVVLSGRLPKKEELRTWLSK
ncbi:thioredoxin family protein [Prolixibacteraceae bacterium JC049]|nr:thioredoxin family protein [Prolixibacteraceae bacterium JC049]